MSSTMKATTPNKMNGKLNLFSHIKYEHMVAGISGMNWWFDQKYIYMSNNWL